MPIAIDHDAANQLLLDALDLAKTGSSLSVEWISFSRSVFALKSKTWTPALATMLLAKAYDGRIDTLSLKAVKDSATAYSARGLCHAVIVPAAVAHQFSIRNTGREPLNNQPFFRYLRLDSLERVRNPEDRDFFLEVARKANDLSARDALRAFAAFLSVALEVASESRKVRVHSEGLSPAGARIAVRDFLRLESTDRPRRLQAFAAACLDLVFVFSTVRARRINDPSRDLPGDVHVLHGEDVILAVEVRGKPVSQAELLVFVRSCSEAGIHRAVVLVDAARQAVLNATELSREAGLPEIQASVFDSVGSLLDAALLWSNMSVESAVETFTERMLGRLREIELTAPTIEEWARAVAVAQGR